MVYIDEDLDEAVEKFKEIGGFHSKREASKRMGEIFNMSLNRLGKGVEEGLEHAVLKEEKDGEKIGFEEEELFF